MVLRAVILSRLYLDEQMGVGSMNRRRPGHDGRCKVSAAMLRAGGGLARSLFWKKLFEALAQDLV